jgi:alpha/beta hydrolase fold
MASEQLKTVLELVGSLDLGTLTIQERRALMGSAGAPPPQGTQVDPVDANGVAAEWVVAAGVTDERVVLFFHGGGYHLGSPARLRGLLALLAAAALTRVLSASYRLAPEHPFPAAVEDALTLTAGSSPAARPPGRSLSAATPQVAGWPWRRSWRCATPATRCPARPSSSRRGPTWTWAASRYAAGRPSM